MLFSGGGTKGTPPKEQRKERKPDREDKYEIQEAVFVRWANSIIDDDVTVQELRDLIDVRFLSKFANLILGVPVAISTKSETDAIDAIFHALVPDDPEERLFQISVNELLSGQQKPLLAMCWRLIQIYWAKFAPPPSNETKLTEALKEWCLEATAGRPDVLINDFTSSFRDGMAINILIKSFDDSLVDLHEIGELRGEDRIENALSLARRHFRVPKLIQPKEFYSEHLDMKSVACYLMMLYLGMCEQSNRQQQQKESTRGSRRRSTVTAPATVALAEAQQPQHSPASSTARPSLAGRRQSSLPRPSLQSQQSLPRQQSLQSQQSHSLPRQQSLAQPYVWPSVPTIVHPQPQSPTRIIAEPQSTPPMAISTTSSMLTPPAVSQSPKAFAYVSGATTMISPLAQQSHSQAQLVQHHLDALQQLHQQQQQQQQVHVQMIQQPTDTVPQPVPQHVAQQIPSVVQQQPQLQVMPQNSHLLQQVPVQQGQAVQPTLVTQQPQMPQQLPTMEPIIQQQPAQPTLQVQVAQTMQQVQAVQPPQQQHVQFVPEPTGQLQQPQHVQFVSNDQMQLAQHVQHLPQVADLQQRPQVQAVLQPTLQPPPTSSAFALPPPPPYETSVIVPPLPPLPSTPAADGSGEGMRSRKSSSSSQSRSRKLRKPEEMIQEYGNCMQQVLSWLNDAEQELDTMTKETVEEQGTASLEVAKEKFREHEQYMQSLTQSQESVGRVLHRGHQLSQRLEGEQAAAIFAQLEVVSARWEHIREVAMQRQSALQNRIDAIQRRHLSEIIAWLDDMDTMIKDQEVVAERAEHCREQLANLEALKRNIGDKQTAIARLSNFVAVIDQTDKRTTSQAEEASNVPLQLETLVKQVSRRWARLNEWTEQRENVLRGMPELLEQYEQTSGQLSLWLNSRFDELQKLRSPQLLEAGEEVQEQLDMLRGMEKALECQQEAFVHLSQVCTELAAKFEKGNNGDAATKVRSGLDQVTQKWDQIVARLENHSELLIRTGKVKMGTGTEEEEERRRKRSARLSTIASADEGVAEQPQQQLAPERTPQLKKRKQLQPQQYLLEEEEPPGKGAKLEGELQISGGVAQPPEGKTEMVAEQISPTSSGGSPPSQDPQQTVTDFVEKVTAVDRQIGSLVEWAGSVELPSSQQQGNVRQSVLECQRKLEEIRQLEPVVTKLQIRLEHIHNRAKLDAKQLHVVNETFHVFISRWSRVVGTISQLLSTLSKPEPFVKPKMAKETKEGRVARMAEQLHQWLKASAKYLEDLPPQLPPTEKLKKIAQIARQLSEQQAQLSHVKRLGKFTPEEDREIENLEQEMVDLLGRIDQMRREAEPQEQSGQRATTTVQMKKESSSPEALSPLIGPSDSMDFSPPPMNEAESLRQKLLAEEAELAQREKERTEEEEEGEGWAKWMRAKEGQIGMTKQCIPGDLGELSEELEKCDEMIAELRSKLRDASTSESDAEMAGPIEKLLRAAESKRNHCVDSINKTQLAIHKAVKVEETGDKFKRELDWLRRNSAETPLKDTEQKLRHMQDSLSTHQSAKAEAIQLLEEVAQSAASGRENGVVAEQMRQRIAKLEGHWHSIEAEIEELLLCCGIERQRRANSWMRAKQELVEELEQALKANFESATDAEELSEHLDNLERLLDRAQSLEAEAVEEGHIGLLMAQSGDKLDALSTHGDDLARAAQERCGQLRNAVARCEHFEQKLCTMQSWCTGMHQILNQRLASDTFALDVPHEYKDAQRQGTLFKKMDKEFAEYDALVDELEQYIEESRAEFASTERLKLQLNHANEQLGQLRAKFNEFKQPITLYEKMERIQKQMAEVETALDDLGAGVQAENCEFCLLHARQLVRQLQELSSECAACEVGRDTLIRERILEEAQAVKISARLTELSSKCVQELEPRAREIVRKLERATEMLEKLERERAVMEKLVKEAENRVDEGKNRSLTMNALEELNRQVKAASDATGKARELEQLLKQLCVRLAGDISDNIASTEAKCAELREEIANWVGRREEEEEEGIGEEQKYAEVERMAQKLGERIGGIEDALARRELEGHKLEEQMTALQRVKEQYERKALELLGNGEYRRRVAPALADLTSRWQKLNLRRREEKKAMEQQQEQAQKARELEKTEKSERESPSLGTVEEQVRMPQQEFGQNVQAMIDAFAKAARYLNFQRHPVKNMQEWERRVTDLNQFVSHRKLRFDELLAEGKRLAESGPMELDTSAALAKLDELIELIHRMDEQIEREENRVFGAKKQMAKLEEQAGMARERIGTLGRRTEQLDQRALDPTPIITLQHELMDTSGQLQLLQLSADELRNHLPPAMHADRIGGEVLDELNRQLHEIECRVQSALLRALQAQQEESAGGPEEPEQEPEEPAETIPTTLLAMDAYGTEDEEGKGKRTDGGEQLEGTISARVPTVGRRRVSAQGQEPGQEQQEMGHGMDELAGMDQFYVNLDTMEEFMEQPELLPYEGFDEKAEILNDFETELERGEQLLAARQMTLEVGEAEHITGRINALRAQLDQRKREVEKRRETVHALEEMYEECEQMLDELAEHCRTPKRIKSPQTTEGRKNKSSPPPLPRNTSPDLDELEASQTALENRLPPVAFRLQQIQNRLNAVAAQLSTAARDQYQERIQMLVEEFNKCAQMVKAKKRAMEARMADQTRINGQMEELEFWCDETEALVSMDEPLGALNLPRLEQHIAKMREGYESADAKTDALRSLERMKDKFVALESVEQQAKHEVRRNVAQLGKRISDLRLKLKKKMEMLTEEKISAEELWREFGAMEQWVQNAQTQLSAVESAKIYKPSLVNVERLASQISENRLALQSIHRRLNEEYRQQQTNVEGEEESTERQNIMRVGQLISAFETVASGIDRLLGQRAFVSEESSATEDEIEQLYEQMDATRQKLAKQQKVPKIEGQGRGLEIPDQIDIEYGTLSSQTSGGTAENGFGGPEQNGAVHGEQQRYPRRKMSLGEQTRLDTVTRLRSWLQEVEREVSATVDLSDPLLIRQTLGKMQNSVDEIQIRQMEIIRVLDEARDRLIVERAQLCSTEMDRVLGICKRRKTDLQNILEQCRIWEHLRCSVELWLTDATDRLNGGGRVTELSDEELAEQLELCAQLTEELNNWKGKLQELNRVTNELLDTHRRDNGHNLSHLSSKLNTQWTKFNDQLRIRRAVLEAAQRSRHDFQTALGHFQQWLNGISAEMQKLERETNNAQRVKDTGRRREWLAQEKEARMEIDAHREIMESVKRMGRKLMEEQRQVEEFSSSAEESPPPSARTGEQLKRRVEAVDGEWQALVELSRIVHERLESAQEECERLTQSLADFLYWTDQQLKTIADSKPVCGDLGSVQRQNEIVRTIERTMEARERQVEECIQLANTYLMQHDLRPALHAPSLLADPSSDLLSPKTEAEREERRVGLQILADSGRLRSQWTLLKEQLGLWSAQVSKALREMQELDRAMAEALLAIGTVEEELNALRPVAELRLEELKDARAECNEFRRRVHESGTSVDDVNDWASNLQAAGIQLSEQLDSQVQAVNARYERLKRDIGCRGAALERAFNDFGPSSEHFLVDLVEPPWQRAISTVNRLPYYIDHSNEQTQWDHPAMVDILEQLCSFNQVKFSAYRTAMKLRALQKRLCLDLIDLADLNVQYEKQLSNCTDEQRIQVEDVIQCLLPLFEKVHEERPALLSNVSLAVDLTLNLLLNIYDPCRDGKMRVLSFKIALVVLCHASLESKYTYLFHLISGQDGVDHKRLAVLFYDLIHIPKFLGEAAAFGGSNIEPSVRSCFEHVKFPPTINAEQFLDWLKKEPQSLVWLPVIHRLASSEFAKHQAKCNACKMFPIVGLRYRCLRCFNFDICQNCFFSQRTAKSHKLSHPMQEYCTPTSAGDDMRDFTVIIRNKVRQGKHRIGYLPVEQINEGPPLECTDQTPQNAATEPMHQRMQLIASRLDKRQTEAAEAMPSAIMPSEGKINGHLLEKGVSIKGPSESENGSIEEQTKQYQPIGEGHRSKAPLGMMAHEAKSPTQLITQVDQASKEELDQLLQKLQYENIELRRAIEERRRALRAAETPFQQQQTGAAKSTPNLSQQQRTAGQQGRQASEMPPTNGYAAMISAEQPMGTHRAQSIGSVPRTPPPAHRHFHSAFPPQQQAILPPPIPRHQSVGVAGHSMPGSLHRQRSLGAASAAFPSAGTLPPNPADQWQEMAVLAEAHHLRLHQKRLEERGMVLEDQNRQLQMQLDRLQRLMKKKGPISQVQQREPAGFISSTEAEDTDMEMLGLAMPMRDIKASGLSSGQLGTEIRRNRMDRLRETVDELNRAMENFVVFTQNCAATTNGSGAGAQLQQQDTDDSGTADNQMQETAGAGEEELR